MQETEADIYEQIVRRAESGAPLALATIVGCEGSTPQKTGAKMLVGEGGRLAGTLGGGCLEAEVVAAARAAIRDGAAATLSFELDHSAGGLVCGGRLQVFIEPLLPRPRLVVLGAGHVGRALSCAARFAGFHVTVVDDREEYADAHLLPDAHAVVRSAFAETFAAVPADAGTFVLVVTRGHKQDLTAVRAALRTPAAWVGLVGSRTKKTLLLEHLAAEGFSGKDCARLVTPAGLPIGSVTPEEIAVSIVAQLIQIRRERGTTSGGPGPRCGLVTEDGGRRAEAVASPRRTAGPEVDV